MDKDDGDGVILQEVKTERGKEEKIKECCQKGTLQYCHRLDGQNAISGEFYFFKLGFFINSLTNILVNIIPTRWINACV